MRCDNCGNERTDRFCPHCGQNDRNFKRALPALVGEVVRETFEVDSRLHRSLTRLLFRPGELSLEFSRNRRADYISPIRLYLFASLAFFFALSLTTEVDLPSPVVQGIESESVTATETDVARLEALLAEPQRARMRQLLARPDSSLARMATVELARSLDDDPDQPGPVGRYVIGLLIDGLYDPARTLDRLLDQLPVAMFVMLPVYALLLALVYLGRRRYFVEHLVFAVHVHTATYVVFTVVVLLPAGSDGSVVHRTTTLASDLLMYALVIYQYVALKRYYGGSHLSTAVRFSGLFLVYVALLVPGVAAVVLLALLVG